MKLDEKLEAAFHKCWSAQRGPDAANPHAYNKDAFKECMHTINEVVKFIRESSVLTEELSLKPHIGPFIEVQAVTDAMVDRFLSWRLPASVCADGCATNPNYPHPRSGTNLLNADEARQMLEHVMVAFARSPQATQSEKP